MQDKSSFSNSNSNQPPISQGLQDFINTMVEEIVLKGEAFDELKRKWLMKYSEAEGLNYAELEGNLKDFFELLDDYRKTQSSALKRMLSNQASACFIDNMLLDKLLSQQPQIILTHDTQFKTVKIGNQIWMAENLNVDRFRNGEHLPYTKTDTEWIKAGNKGKPASCFTNGVVHGKLYNWYAVNDPRNLAPKGWHIPSDEEWTQLTDFLGGESWAGYKMKSNKGWIKDGCGSNESGFSALPSGYRWSEGFFVESDIETWWSSTFAGRNGQLWDLILYDNLYAWCRLVNTETVSVIRNNFNRRCGLSVRCIMD